MDRINGHIVAPFTPFQSNGSLNLELIPEYTEFIIRNGMQGVFICGSSGEGALLTREERMLVAEKWMESSEGRLKVIVHTAGCCLEDQKLLAAHAQNIGAFGIGAMAPAFLPPRRNEELLAYCKAIASSAPELPFYYYHIPGLNGVNLSMIDLLKSVDKEIPNFAGIKYTQENIHEFAQCKKIAGGKFDMLHGLDETYLSGLAFGTKSGVGGTYNHMFGVFKSMTESYDKGESEKCIDLQHKSQLFVNILIKYRGNIVGGKRIMKFLGLDCGPNRLPLQTITEEEEKLMKKELEEIGFFNWCNR